MDEFTWGEGMEWEGYPEDKIPGLFHTGTTNTGDKLEPGWAAPLSARGSKHPTLLPPNGPSLVLSRFNRVRKQ